MKRIVAESRVEVNHLENKLEILLSYGGKCFHSIYIPYQDIKDYYAEIVKDTVHSLNCAIGRYDCVIEDTTDRQFIDGKFVHTGKFYKYNKHIILPPLTESEIKVIQDSVDIVKYSM